MILLRRHGRVNHPIRRPFVKHLSLSAAALVALCGSAHAVTMTSLPGAPDPGPGMGETIVVDFDNANAAGYTWSAGTIATAMGTTGGVAAAPAGDATKYGYVSSALTPNFATLSTPMLKSISLYWGSVDKYNFVDVLGAGNVVLGTFSGGMLPQSDGNQFINSTNRRVTFTAGTGEVITGLTIRSTGVAFEFDDIAAAPIPEPGTWALMAGGLAAVGFLARRRKQQA
jgi:hypothetical protein